MWKIVIEVLPYAGPGTQVGLEDALQKRLEEFASYGLEVEDVKNPTVSVEGKIITGSMAVRAKEKTTQ